jgi:hypothetical protein
MAKTSNRAAMRQAVARRDLNAAQNSPPWAWTWPAPTLLGRYLRIDGTDFHVCDANARGVRLRGSAGSRFLTWTDFQAFRDVKVI